MEEGDRGVEAQEGGQRDEAGGGGASEEVEGVGGLCVFSWLIGRDECAYVLCHCPMVVVSFSSRTHPTDQPQGRPTHLPEHCHHLKGLDGQVLADEEDAVVRKVKALPAAAVVP